MRKIYETDRDRENQLRVSKYLEKTWDCVFKKAVDLAAVDGAIFTADKKLAALIEIKTRRNPSDRYPTYMLSAHKWRRGLDLANKYQVPLMLVVEFTNGVYATKLKNDYTISKGGRLDRGDSMDIENCIYIPMNEFRKV